MHPNRQKRRRHVIAAGLRWLGDIGQLLLNEARLDGLALGLEVGRQSDL